jgi:four helix bundle protein
MKMDEYVHFIYKKSRDFPKEESYNSTSQVRRAALSIILNYIEGYARRKPAVQLNFFETSYGSLKESEYLIQFAKDEKWINLNDLKEGNKLADEIGAMLWTEIKNLDKKLNE